MSPNWGCISLRSWQEFCAHLRDAAPPPKYSSTCPLIAPATKAMAAWDHNSPSLKDYDDPFPIFWESKGVKCRGVFSILRGGMLKLWFDWYIINYEKVFCCIRDKGLRVKMSIFVLRTFFQCSSPSSSLAGRGALRNSWPSCCEGDHKELGAKIESGGQFIPYGFYFRLRARCIITYRATKSPQQATKVAKSDPAEKTCNFVLCILSITWEYKQQISVGGAVRKEILSSQYAKNQMTLARAHNRDTHWCDTDTVVSCCRCFAVFSSKYMYLHRVRPPLP